MSAVLLRGVRHRAFVDQIEGVYRPFNWSPLIRDDFWMCRRVWLAGLPRTWSYIGIFSIEGDPARKHGRRSFACPPSGSTTSCDWCCCCSVDADKSMIRLATIQPLKALLYLLLCTDPDTPSNRRYHKEVFLTFLILYRTLYPTPR